MSEPERLTSLTCIIRQLACCVVGCLALTGVDATFGISVAAADDKVTDDTVNNDAVTDDNGKASATSNEKKQPKTETAKSPVPDTATTDDMPENPFPNRVKITDGILEGGAEWLNTSGPITIRDLRGKIVVLDFWTYCCINCMHVLPDLKYLEEKYPNELVVIGVHSAKFDNEKVSENIRQAILRYEIEHPVVNDNEMAIWRKFGTRSWPTLALVDPEGYFVGAQPGEGNRELFDTVIGKLIAYHRARGTLDESPIRFDLERNREPQTPLRFPGKVLADAAGQRLFISDSNNNRIVVASLTGELLDVIGNGMLGIKDGAYADALFDHPQGMELVGQTLYVADTENHAIRAVDLEKKLVSTLAGTGEQARIRVAGGPLSSTPLNSPWAITHIDGTLYIAMAGPHQIWSHQLGDDFIGVYAGNGREDIINGPLDDSSFAQPSGMVTDGRYLFVVDSEGSSVRQIDTQPDGKVTTIVGTSELPHAQSLFAFGDQDGTGEDVRLQHPLGVALHDGTLFVADTYNHRIKQVDVSSRKATTWIGDGQPGRELAPARFSEPGGLSIADGKLYIADTNNHRICVADMETATVTVFEVAGLTPPPSTRASRESRPASRVVTALPDQVVAAGGSLNVNVKLSLPEGYKLNTAAPVTWKLETDNDDQTLIEQDELDARREIKANDDIATVTIPIRGDAGAGAEFVFVVTWGFCRDGVGGLCKMRTARWKIPVRVDASAKATTIELTAE